MPVPHALKSNKSFIFNSLNNWHDLCSCYLQPTIVGLCIRAGFHLAAPVARRNNKNVDHRDQKPTGL
ncbi:hypothetical protein EMIT0P100_200074 [Pseudomonas sp. IT-P100]